MTTSNIWAIGAIGFSLIAGTPAAVADTTDAMLARVGQFQLDSGETKTVVRNTAVEGYRVCMEEGTKAVPLKVIHDGKETIVEPGDCQLIVAHKIKLASAARLQSGMTLIGSFDATSKTRLYKTDVSVAQAARND